MVGGLRHPGKHWVPDIRQPSSRVGTRMSSPHGFVGGFTELASLHWVPAGGRRGGAVFYPFFWVPPIYAIPHFAFLKLNNPLLIVISGWARLPLSVLGHFCFAKVAMSVANTLSGLDRVPAARCLPQDRACTHRLSAVR